MKLCLLAVASSTLLFTSCAQDGFDDETFVGTYSGYPLGNPDPEAITVKASSDKLSQTITWPAVNGAGTYTVTVYMGENYENLVIDKQVVKVNYITIPRIDKTFYRISILVNDNIPEGNTGSTAPTDYDWDTFTINVATIPTGENLNSWFKANPHNFVLEGVITLLLAFLVTGFCILTSHVLRVSPVLKKWLFGRT